MLFERFGRRCTPSPCLYSSNTSPIVVDVLIWKHYSSSILRRSWLSNLLERSCENHNVKQQRTLAYTQDGRRGNMQNVICNCSTHRLTTQLEYAMVKSHAVLDPAIQSQARLDLDYTIRVDMNSLAQKWLATAYSSTRLTRYRSKI